MRILLVRHAHAGVRGAWPGDDFQRELSDLGRAQAAAIAEQWGGAAIGAVHSSRAERCMATVAPLAARAALDVVATPELLEGAAPAEALAWMEALAPTTDHDTVVACSHGDVIGGVLHRLDRRGAALEGDLHWPKGSTWELEVDDGLVVAGRLHPTPDTAGV